LLHARVIGGASLAQLVNLLSRPPYNTRQKTYTTKHKQNFS
jgi:hypothetical protein